MIEIDLLNELHERERINLAEVVKSILPRIRYNVARDDSGILVMEKTSEYYNMKGQVAVGNDKKLGGFFIAGRIAGENNEPIACPDYFSDGKEYTMSWFLNYHDKYGWGSLVFGMMEAFLSGATNEKPILNFCTSIKRKGVKIPSARERYKRIEVKN